MKTHKLKDFTRGWLIGDFEPSIFKTKDFEVSIMRVDQGKTHNKHLHKIAEEITIIVSGKFKINGEVFNAGDIIHLEPGESSETECLESGVQTVIKIPSVIGDKCLID